MTIRLELAGALVAATLLVGVGARAEDFAKPPATMTAEERQALIKANEERIAEERQQQLAQQRAREAELRRIADETTPAEEKAFQAMDLAKVKAEQAQAKTWLAQYPAEARKLAMNVSAVKQSVAATDPEIAPIQQQVDALQLQIYELQGKRDALVDQNPRVREAVAAVDALARRQRELAIWEQKLWLRASVLERDAERAAKTAATQVEGGRE